jgi:hypothetical protein
LISAEMAIPPLARRVLDAYGGEERWRALRRISFLLSAWGWALRAKSCRPFDDAHAEVEVWAPRARIQPLGASGLVGVLDGNSVHLEDGAGNVVASRDDPRRFFPGGRRFLWWDDLDHAFFATYALWNYLAFPALLLRDDVRWTEVGPSTLEASFDPALPTHSPTQRFHVDPASALLRQHDYTALVFGRWARAAHVVLEHRTSASGVPWAARRRAMPRLPTGRPAPWPVLVALEIDGWEGA